MVTGYISTDIFEKDNETILYDQFYISAIVILSCLLAVLSIFSYKNRLTSDKIGDHKFIYYIPSGNVRFI